MSQSESDTLVANDDSGGLGLDFHKSSFSMQKSIEGDLVQGPPSWFVGNEPCIWGTHVAEELMEVAWEAARIGQGSPMTNQAAASYRVGMLRNT